MSESESVKPKSAADRITILVALASSIASAVLAIFNVIFYLADRQDRASKDAFDGQMTLAKSYFDTFGKLPVEEFCRHRPDAELFWRTSVNIAGLDEGEVTKAVEATGPDAGPARRDGVQAVAFLISRNLLSRAKDCDGRPAVIVQPAGGGLAVAAYDATSSYALRQQDRPAAPPAAAARTTVWIHYQRGTPADRARALQQAVAADPAYSAPGIQGVAATPSHDQVRLFHEADRGKAQALIDRMGLKGAQIVSLERAYQNLPTGVMEVWLAAPAGTAATAEAEPTPP